MIRAARIILSTLAVMSFCLASVIAVRTALLRSRQIIGVPGAPGPQLHAPGAVERFAGAIRFKTISVQDSDPATDKEFTRFHDFLRISFPRVHRTLVREVVGDYSLLYTWQGQDAKLKPILLMGHMDVVPVEPGHEHKWTHPPFAGRVADGYIWGRGTMDDKVNVLGILEAVEILLSEAFQPRRTVYLAFGHDEEGGGQRGAARIAALLGQREVKLDFVLDEGSVITQGIIPGIDTAVAAIGTAEKGYLNLQFTVDAPGGHPAMPPAGSAIGILSHAIAKIERTPFPARISGAVEEFFDFAGPEMPWAHRAVLANRWLFEPWLKRELGKSPLTATMIRTTQAATLFRAGIKENVLPSQARAVINFRLLSGDNIEQVQTRIREIVSDERVKIAPLGTPMEASPVSRSETGGFKLIQRTIRQVVPDAIVAPFLVIAATDARHYGKLTADIFRFVPITVRPQDTSRFHGVDERVSVKEYERCVEFYARLIRNSQP
jgi:carboxypeptidase PM20D1